jgi:hypothetical protein
MINQEEETTLGKLEDIYEDLGEMNISDEDEESIGIKPEILGNTINNQENIFLFDD